MVYKALIRSHPGTYLWLTLFAYGDELKRTVDEALLWTCLWFPRMPTDSASCSVCSLQCDVDV